MLLWMFAGFNVKYVTNLRMVCTFDEHVNFLLCGVIFDIFANVTHDINCMLKVSYILVTNYNVFEYTYRQWCTVTTWFIGRCQTVNITKAFDFFQKQQPYTCTFSVKSILSMLSFPFNLLINDLNYSKHTSSHFCSLDCKMMNQI